MEDELFAEVVGVEVVALLGETDGAKEAPLPLKRENRLG